MNHVLTNLLTNAVKYSPDGGEVRLGARVDGQRVIFTVSDHGLGIPPEDQAYIFEPFYRASNVKRMRGTGLGLSIVQEYVALQGGSVTCQSEVGKGTAFTVEIPLSHEMLSPGEQPAASTGR